ncbi:hypothetical protein D3C72_2085020 [compost metagenome]
MLFARKRGLRFIAAKGKIGVQAQSDDIEAIAQKVLRLISTQERIEITSPTGITFNAAGSYLKVNGSSIEYSTPGTWMAHAAAHHLPGPKALQLTQIAPPSDVCLPCAVQAARQGAAVTERSAGGATA